MLNLCLPKESVLGFLGDTEPTVSAIYMFIYKDIYYKGLAHMTTKAEKY